VAEGDETSLRALSARLYADRPAELRGPGPSAGPGWVMGSNGQRYQEEPVPPVRGDHPGEPAGGVAGSE